MFATKKLYVQGETENQNQHVLQNEPPIIKKELGLVVQFASS